MDSQRHEEYNHKNTNYHDFFELDYYKPNPFNWADDLPKAFHIQNHLELEY